MRLPLNYLRGALQPMRKLLLEAMGLRCASELPESGHLLRLTSVERWTVLWFGGLA